MDFLDQAGKVVRDLAEKAEPLVDKTAAAVGELAEKAKPYAEKAAKGVQDAVAKLDDSMDGKLSKAAETVRDKVQSLFSDGKKD